MTTRGGGCPILPLFFMVEHGRRKRCAGRQRALRLLPHLTPDPHERFELRCCRLCRAGSRPMLPEAEGDISPDGTGKTAFVRKGKRLRGGDFYPARGYGVRHAPGPPLRRENRQGKLASRALSMFRAGRRASPALRRGRPGRAQTQRASLQHARAQDMNSPCRSRPRLPRRFRGSRGR